MLTLSSWPPELSPAALPLRFVFSGDSDGSVNEIEFTDADAGTLLGVRTAVDFGDAEIDASRFASRALSPRPSAAAGCALAAGPGRALSLGVNRGSARPRVVTVLAAAETVAPYAPQTLAGVRTIAPGERDEISLAVPACTVEARLECMCPETVTLPLAPLEAKAGSATLTVDFDALCATLRAAGADSSRLRSVRAVLEPSGGPASEFTFVPAARPAGAVRVCWLSARGAVEHCTFPRLLSDGVQTERRRAAGGGPTVRCLTRRVLRAASDYLPAERLERLSGAASSPAVWRVEAGAYIPVEAEAREATFRADGFCRLELTLRDARAVQQGAFGL